MLVRKLRLQRGWSQEQLAELTDLSVRTIQRAEQGFPQSLETRKAFTAVFGSDYPLITPEEPRMSDEAFAMEYVQGINAFEVINLFGPNWERKRIEKRLGRKL